MLLLDYIAIGIVVLLLLVQWRAPATLRRYERQIYVAVLFVIITTLLYQVHAEFIELITSPAPTRYYGPPYTSIAFFLFSSWSRVVGPYTLSIFISLLALWGMLKPSRYNDRFEAGEPYIIAASLALLRHPFWMLYAIAAIVLYLLISFYHARRGGSHTRVSFYKIWLPLTLIALMATPLLAKISGLSIISFANLH